MTIEVFKTDVREEGQAAQLSVLLAMQFPGSRISFDLEDCDKVLRIEGMDICPDTVTHVLGSRGFYCGELD